jgi:chemotaxis protein CheD
MQLQGHYTSVNIGEIKMAEDQTSLLLASSLGSCLGLAVFDEKKKIGAVGHFLLPQSSLDPVQAKEKPGKFVDTGIELLLKWFTDRGSSLNQLIIVAAGCASILDPQKHFNIGERNLLMMRKYLWKHKLFLYAERTGGEVPRSLYLDMSSGSIYVLSGGKKEILK